MGQKTMIQAINEGLRLAMEEDSSVLLFGEDVGQYGGVFRATEGLQKHFGTERVFDTPLAESAIGGLAIGLCFTGFRPIAEIQFFGFVFETFDSIAGQANRMRARTGGRFHCPVVFRSPFGGGVKTPELHADSLEGLMAQTPGLKVVMPSNPYDAKGLLISSIEDNDPVIFLEHMKLYRSFRGEVPENAYKVPLGKANVVREGTDVTIISYGAMVHTALQAAENMVKEKDIDAEVIDLRTIYPLDIETVLASIKKTNRAVVVQEAQKKAGIAPELMAQIMEQGILHLEAPVLRVSAPDTIYPFASLEESWLPDQHRVAEKVYEVMQF